MRDRSITAICHTALVGPAIRTVRGITTTLPITSRPIIIHHRGRSASVGTVHIGAWAFTQVFILTIGHTTLTATDGEWDTTHGFTTGIIARVGTTAHTRKSCTLT